MKRALAYFIKQCRQGSRTLMAEQAYPAERGVGSTDMHECARILCIPAQNQAPMTAMATVAAVPCPGQPVPPRSCRSFPQPSRSGTWSCPHAYTSQTAMAEGCEPCASRARPSKRVDRSPEQRSLGSCPVVVPLPFQADPPKDLGETVPVAPPWKTCCPASTRRGSPQ